MGSLVRGYALRRLLTGSRRRGGGGGYPRGSAGYRGGPYRSASYGARAGGRPRSGFGFWGPVPSYSRTTRRGNRVRVGGCCLPILMLALAGLAGIVASVL